MEEFLSEVRVWRLSLALRVFAGVAIVGMALVSVGVVAMAFDSGPLTGILIVLVFPAFMGALGSPLWRDVLSPRVSAGPRGVSFRRGRDTTYLPWSVIARCRATPGGIVIEGVDGEEWLAPAPQKSPVASWLGLRTRADVAAAYIQQRARQYRDDRGVAG